MANKYEMIENYLHTADAKAFVKEGNWAELSKTLLTFFSDKDSGRFGKVYEIVTKLYLNGYKGNSCIVSAKGKVDVTFRGQKVEIKSNCGQIAPDFMRNNLVIYSMDNEKDVANPANGKVMTPDAFMYLMDTELGLIRYHKKSTANTFGVAIQSYKNSNKKSSALAIKLLGCKTVAELKRG